MTLNVSQVNATQEFAQEAKAVLIDVLMIHRQHVANVTELTAQMTSSAKMESVPQTLDLMVQEVHAMIIDYG